jgi:isopenicillin-N N-acyltransferase-like protein
VRVNRANRLIRNTREHTIDTVKAVLSDHVNYPNSICSHSDPNDRPLDRQKTIATLIMDMTALEMQICWGNPCEAAFETYRLEA